MKDDDQVKAAISIKKDMVINTGWKIECESEEIREWIKNVLGNINSGLSIATSFEDGLRDILSSFEYGFSLTEPVYKLIDNKWEVKELRTRPPHTFMFNMNEKGQVESIIQTQNKGEVEFKPRLFLHHVYQSEFSNPYGKSDLKAAHNSWKAKKFVQRFLAMYLEKFAQPTVVGRYPDTMDTNEITRMQDVLKSIQTSTTLALPEGMTVDLLFPQRDSSDAYRKAIDLFNMQIARSILVPDLMGIGGSETKGGSLALGKEQFKVFLGTIEKERQSLARKLTLKLIQPMVKMNFGEIDCEFQFVEFAEGDIAAYADLWVKAVTGKIFRPNEEEINHFRSITGFPEGDVDIPEPVQPPPMLPGNNPFDKSAGNPGKKEQPGNVSEDDRKADKEMTVKHFRELTTYERKVNFREIEGILDKSERIVMPDLNKNARAIYEDYIEQVKNKGLLKRFRPEKINELKFRFQAQMKTTLKRHFRDLFKDGIERAKKEIFPHGDKTFSDALLPEQFEEIIDAEAFKMVGDYSVQITKNVRNVVVDAIKAGKGESEIVALIKDAAKKETERWLETVIRTKTTETYNQARRSYWENDPIASQIVESYQFSAIIDSRTSDICSYYDGKIFKADDPDIHRMTPPLHFNCRSLLIPITRFEQHTTIDVPGVDVIQKRGGNLKTFSGGKNK